MVELTRYSKNPILTPDETSPWEAVATYNISLYKEKDLFHAVYRALSSKFVYYENETSLSTIGYAKSEDGINFIQRRQFITPENEWEKFGCEDPRITKFNGNYYIFYTALSDYPHSADGIKVAVAITKDFKEVDEKHLVTPFNAKAMALFPQKVNGKYAAILSVNTDRPPADISIAYFDKIEQMWSEDYWHKWYEKKNEYSISLVRSSSDHAEVGAVPIKTKFGWLVVYSNIYNYFKPPPTFSIEAVLLDKDNPVKVVARTKGPLMIPYEEYEKHGVVKDVVFPTSAYVEKQELNVYYGATDTTVCLAKMSLEDLLKDMVTEERTVLKKTKDAKLVRFDKNPIISPNKENEWESQSTFNPTAIMLDKKVHILYRALSGDNTSTVGYATSRDGFNIDKKFPFPIYIPRVAFEKKKKPNGYSGCEDARISRIGDTLYMCYTAYVGEGKTNIALTTIKVDDFIKNNWEWSKPVLISDPDRSDKNSCVLEEKIDNRYVFFHRLGGCIWLDYVDDLSFSKEKLLGGVMMLCPRKGKWDSRKVGIGGPPIKSEYGWVLIYHGLSKEDDKYRLGALLLESGKPENIIARLDYPILEPLADYEKSGLRPDAVFTCGSVVKNGKLFVYYGGADQVVCVATMSFDNLVNNLRQNLV